MLLGAGAGLGTSLLATACGGPPRRMEQGPIAALFPGTVDDDGFMAAGSRGLMRIERELHIPVRSVTGIPPDTESIQNALREMARSEATLVIALGEAASAPAQRVAWEFPDLRFVSVGGRSLRPNLAIYDVGREESAWLAGALAASLSRSNIVGHVAGTREGMALRVRAAFAAGLAFVNPQLRFLTRFSGEAGDAAAARIVSAQIDAGADHVFNALERGQAGVIEVCRARGVPQIGATRDWVEAMPDAFIAAAVADAAFAVWQAGRDLRDGVWRGDYSRRFGLRYPEAARIALSATIPGAIRGRIEDWKAQIIARKIAIPETYAGAEFPAQ